MARTRNEKDAEILGLDDPIKVEIDEIETRGCAEVPKQARLDVRR